MNILHVLIQVYQFQSHSTNYNINQRYKMDSEQFNKPKTMTQVFKLMYPRELRRNDILHNTQTHIFEALKTGFSGFSSFSGFPRNERSGDKRENGTSVFPLRFLLALPPTPDTIVFHLTGARKISSSVEKPCVKNHFRFSKRV